MAGKKTISQIDFNNKITSNVPTPINNDQIANKLYVDTEIAIPKSIGTASDVDITTILPSINDILRYDGVNFVPTPTFVGGYGYFPIWAEEGDQFITNTFQYSYGNGANTPINNGIYVGANSELFAVGVRSNSGSGNIEIFKNGVPTITTGLLPVGGDYINLTTPIQFNSGDFLNFRTVSGSGGFPIQVVAWFRYEIPTIRGEKGEKGDTGNGDFVWRSSFNIGQIYINNDVVEYLGSTYRCYNTTTGSELPTDPLFWELVAQKGDKGDDGSGISINVTSSGNTLPNNPFDTLNFSNEFNLIDEGNGTVTIGNNFIKNLEGFNVVDTIGGQTITTANTPITLSFNSISYLDSNTFSFDGQVITILRDTTLYLHVDVSAFYPGISTGVRTGSSFFVERNSGSVFSEVSGTRGHMYHRATASKSTGTVSGILQVNAGDQLRIRLEIDANNVQDVQTLPNGSRITLFNIFGVKGDKGDKGDDGSNFNDQLFGDGAPLSTLGINGDIYFDNLTGDLYKKEIGVWNLQQNLRGPSGFLPDLLQVTTLTQSNVNNTSGVLLTTINTTPEINTNTLNYTVFSNGIQINNSGIYEIYANFYFTSSSQRTNVGIEFTINGISQNKISASNYIRAASNHNEASTSLTQLLNINSGDLISVRFTGLAGLGTVTIPSDNSHIIIKKLN